MDRPTQAPRRSGRIMLVVEIERDVYHPPKWVRATVSRPGTQGVISRVFSTDGDRVTPKEVNSLTSWVQISINNAMATTEGIQHVLIVDEDLPQDV